MLKLLKYLSDDAGDNRNMKLFFLIKIDYSIIFQLATCYNMPIQVSHISYYSFYVVEYYHNLIV